MTLVLVLIPRVGVASVLMATMAGQLIVSMIFDHFGWLGNPVIPFGPARLVGGVCLILGVVLIRYRITSYNVCYTKLLRAAVKTIMEVYWERNGAFVQKADGETSYRGG